VYSQPEHASGSVAADSFQGINDPSFNLICKFIEGDVFLILVIRFAIHLNIISGKLSCQLDVQPALAYGK
jgi:hypothetical protein